MDNPLSTKFHILYNLKNHKKSDRRTTD
jgi:hypothetical protein